jgi:hypothetical protein
LSPQQYENTLRDLVGDGELSLEYDDDGEVITERGVRQLRSAAEKVVARRPQWSETVFPCDVTGARDDECARQFTDTFASRAFRRPLTGDERSWLFGVYESTTSELDFQAGMQALLEVTLQAPQVIYVPQTGQSSEGTTDGVRGLDDYELATRLSYFLWNTTHDRALLEAAEAGELTEPGGLRGQADRMLADARAKDTIRRFFWKWMQLDGGRLHHPLSDTEKNDSLYPEYGQTLRQSMREAFETYVTHIFYEENASFEKFFTDTSAYVNGPLAELYGVQGPGSADDWQWAELDGSRRAGALTRAAFLTVFSSAKVTSPIRRGVFVIEEVLCNELGEPPPNVDDTPVEGGEVEGSSGEVRTVREDVMARTQGDTCQSCHSVINPIGFTFEHYDAIGAWQQRERTTGLEVDASGRLQGSDVDGPMEGAVELSEALARSERVRSCFADRWLSRALGQPADAVGDCIRDRIKRQFVQSGDMRALILSIVESDAFRFVRTEQEG